MARIVQVILPLVCVVLAEADLHIPFFHIPGLPHPARPILDGPRDNRPSQDNVDYNGGYNSWFQHFGNPDAHHFDSDSHERDNSYEDFDPFYHSDPYYQDDGWDEIHHASSHNPHRHPPTHKEKHRDEKPKQDHNDVVNVHKPEDNPKKDEKPTEQEKGPKVNEGNISDVKNVTDILPPKTNEIKKENDKGGNDDKKDVGVDKKKDFLLIGQGNNGNDVYLLHENNPNPNTVPNTNQLGNNIMYVPYNPGQSNNPVYQVINAQPAPLGTNTQMTPNKIVVPNVYNNAASNPGQPGNQNPGYVTIYSNGQLIQIPGVVVNSAPNNGPSLNGNQGQGTNYIIANTVPNNMQNVPAIQNPGTNVIYATLPNQPSNGPIYVQVPNCNYAIPSGCNSGTVAQNSVQGVNNGMTNNGLPNNAVVYQPNSNTVSQPAGYPNGVSNGYVQPNMVASPGQGTMAVASPNQNNPVYNNQNGQYQPAVELPVNSGSNGYNQPIVSNLGQGTPNQGGMINNQNMPIMSGNQLPVSSNNNGYNQPLVSSQKQEVNTPNQGGMINNQNMAIQPAVEMPVNSGIPIRYNQPTSSNQGQGQYTPNQGTTVNNQNMPLQPGVQIPITNGYNDHPMVANPSPGVNVESRVEVPNNQNAPSQPAVSANSDSNGYNQPPQVSNQGDQATNSIVNTPNSDVASQPGNTQPLATSLVLDSNNLSSLGAQPAIMISGFKDTGDKKDKKKSKDKKEKKDEENKDKEKKKDEKPKDVDKPKVPEPFTNKKIQKR